MQFYSIYIFDLKSVKFIEVAPSGKVNNADFAFNKC